MVLSQSLDVYVSLLEDFLLRHDRSKDVLGVENHDPPMWSAVKKRVYEYVSSGSALFDCEKYSVVILKGVFRDECVGDIPMSTYRVTMKSSNASWTVPRLGTCVENLVVLAQGEFEDTLSRSIENLLQELAEDVSHVVTFGNSVPGWCDSRADVVDMFRLVAPNDEVIFPLTAGNRYGISYGAD